LLKVLIFKLKGLLPFNVQEPDPLLSETRHQLVFDFKFIGLIEFASFADMLFANSAGKLCIISNKEKGTIVQAVGLTYGMMFKDGVFGLMSHSLMSLKMTSKLILANMDSDLSMANISESVKPYFFYFFYNVNFK